mgnify:CR=1 FL=1
MPLEYWRENSAKNNYFPEGTEDELAGLAIPVFTGNNNDL